MTAVRPTRSSWARRAAATAIVVVPIGLLFAVHTVVVFPFWLQLLAAAALAVGAGTAIAADAGLRRPWRYGLRTAYALLAIAAVVLLGIAALFLGLGVWFGLALVIAVALVVWFRGGKRP